MSRVSSFLLIACLIFVISAPAISQDHEPELEKALSQTRKAQEQLKRELDEARAHGRRMQQEAEEQRRMAERAREQAEMERMRAQEMSEHLRDRGRNPERELMERLERLAGAHELLMQAGEPELAKHVAERMEQTQEELIRLRIREKQRRERDRPRDEPNQRRVDRDREHEREHEAKRLSAEPITSADPAVAFDVPDVVASESNETMTAETETGVVDSMPDAKAERT